MNHKIAVVTGGSRGIGKAIVLALAGAGYQIAFSYVRDEEAAMALRAEVEAMGRECLASQCDVKDGNSIKGFFERVEQQLVLARQSAVEDERVVRADRDRNRREVCLRPRRRQSPQRMGLHIAEIADE